jgi:hypothetical protein
MLPKIAYVYEEADRDGTKFLVASKEAEGLEGSLLGVYELRETLHVRHKTQFRRPKTKAWFDKAP